jgi:hypothetical protein
MVFAFDELLIYHCPTELTSRPPTGGRPIGCLQFLVSNISITAIPRFSAPFGKR